MKIELEIPKEFEKDYNADKFEDFFGRVMCVSDSESICGLYEYEVAEMFLTAFQCSKRMRIN